MTLRWDPVDGAAGYVVQRADAPGGPFQTVDHHGGDVLAVPGPTYADTTGQAGTPYWYAIASITSADGAHGERSAPVRATSREERGAVEIRVDAQHPVKPLARPWHMVGSERLSQLLHPRDANGADVGLEFAESLRIARVELGADRVRAHGVLHDDLGCYTETDGRPCYDFASVARVYDQVLSLGLRPVVELSFMPRALASNPQATVFAYKAISSPPKDYAAWGALVRALAQYLVDRYGVAEVADWGFEVWNEPNLELFWTGSRDDYFRLYDVAARAIKTVDRRLKVGGPATAAAGWIADFAVYAADSGAPVDFLSTHTYGNVPLDIAATAANAGLERRPVWWTEWGVSPTHFARINDSVLGAPFVLHGMFSAMDRAEHLAYWTISDHFEELGRPPRLFHGGFGLLTVGNLRKPRFWALRMLEMLGSERLNVAVAGDGAESMVQAIATRDVAGMIQVLVWNGTMDQTKQDGTPLLGRQVRLGIEGLATSRYTHEHLRVDRDHSNVSRAWAALGSPDWPDEAGWAHLRAADRLVELEPSRPVEAAGGHLAIDFEIPMPGVSLVRLTPAQ